MITAHHGGQANAAAARPQLTKSSDGPVSLLINRRISIPMSAALARVGVSPNAATLLALAIGGAAGAAFALRVWWLGGLLWQLSSILSGVDGEIARRTGKSSRYGDFLDTTVDRLVEYGGLAGIAYGLSEVWGREAWVVGLGALGGTFMLAAAAEKYRSTMQENYPKRRLEPLFAYLASGRDVRVFYIALAALIATWEVDVLFWTLVALAAAMHVNFLYRVLLLRQRMAPARPPAQATGRRPPSGESRGASSGGSRESLPHDEGRTGRPPASGPTTIFFDLGDTLWHFPTPTPRETVQRETERRIRGLLLGWGGPSEGAGAMAQAIRRGIIEGDRTADRGDLRSPDYVAIAREAAAREGLTLSRAQADDVWHAYNLGGPFLGRRLFPETHATLDWLRANGFRIAVITNRAFGGRAFLDELAADDLLHNFEVVSISADVGWRKPHAAIFGHAMAAMRVAPEQSVLVGDEPLADVGGAKALGMTAVLKRNGELDSAGAAASASVPTPDYVIDSLADLRALPLFAGCAPAPGVQSLP